ncbi:MAG: large conductance mechanosensitive channel protein MscL [Dehalococcoidales bacterium]|nr:large conductance mechanosensitive channel protein MscL [Dehalococcoidales bacterium]
MLKEFRQFIIRGNVVDMAVGIIVGIAFGALITSLVADILMPPIGLLVGNVDFANLFVVLKSGSPAAPYASLADAKVAGAVTINYGVFVMAIISFIIIMFALFMIVRYINRLRYQVDRLKEETAQAEPTIKECPFCFSSIPIKASRCPQCTSQLEIAAK